MMMACQLIAGAGQEVICQQAAALMVGEKGAQDVKLLKWLIGLSFLAILQEILS